MFNLSIHPWVFESALFSFLCMVMFFFIYACMKIFDIHIHNVIILNAWLFIPLSCFASEILYVASWTEFRIKASIHWILKQNISLIRCRATSIRLINFCVHGMTAISHYSIVTVLNVHRSSFVINCYSWVFFQVKET